MVLDLYTVKYKLNDAGWHGGGMIVVAARNHEDAEAIMVADGAECGIHLTCVEVVMLITNVSGFTHGVVDIFEYGYLE